MVGKGLLTFMAMLHVNFTIAMIATDIREKLIAAITNARWIFYASLTNP